MCKIITLKFLDLYDTLPGNKLYNKLTGEIMKQNEVIKKGETKKMKNKVVNASGGAKCDGNKPDWTLLPVTSLEETVKILEFGADKYGRENWKKVEVERYEKALLRHIIAYWSGQKNDPETNLSHLSHAICNCLFILYLQNKS